MKSNLFNNLPLAENNFEEIPSDYINDTLSIYCPDKIYLKSAIINDTELVGLFKLEHYPFTRDEYIHYLTASMLFLLLSQASYVYGRNYLENNSLLTGDDFSVNKFFKIRDGGNFLITNIGSIKFKRRIAINEDTIPIHITCDHIHKLNNTLFAKMKFDVSSRAISGSFNLAILQD